MKKSTAIDSNLTKLGRRCLMAAVAACLPLSPSAMEQTLFQSPDLAANTLVISVARGDTAALEGALGEDYREVLPLGDISAEEKDRFFQAWAAYHTLVPTDANTRMLAVGEKGWTLPIPIVRAGEGWRFDTAAGGELMRIRRIGRNELSTMQALLAYRDAQLDYAREDRDGDGVLEYAQHFLSSEGQHDGLYWDTPPDQPESPLGPLFAEEKPEGAYHGYNYRVLTSQGEDAPGGAKDYVQDGNMVGGFAVIAWPADYGNSGVTSFMLGRDSVLYEADLGPDSAAAAAAMPGFDPDARWTPVAPMFARSE